MIEKKKRHINGTFLLENKQNTIFPFFQNSHKVYTQDIKARESTYMRRVLELEKRIY